MSKDPSRPLHVVAAVLRDAADRVLLSRRHEASHQGGLWEFPGGKLEPGESAPQGLARELREELDIDCRRSRPFLRVDHAYPDLVVRLDVHEVLDWSGEVRAVEGQALRWTDPHRLDPADFPAADVPVLKALKLPAHYVISDEPANRTGLLERLDACLARGERLFQLRAKRMAPDRLGELVGEAVRRCDAHGARLLVNAEPEQVRRWGAHGVHLTAQRLMALDARPLDPDRLVAASCHDAAQLARAHAIGADFAVLSPLRPTPSHPHATPLGWVRFTALAADAGLPVYALGGVDPGDLDAVRRAHGFGVAGIGAFWGRG